MDITMLAHVKWFAPFDVGAPPRPIGDVLNGSFIQLFLVSVAGIYFFFLTDRIVFRRRLLRGLDERLKQLDGLSILILRSTAAIFLALAWLCHSVLHGSAFYITPELKTEAVYVPWLQLALGLCALFQTSLPLSRRPALAWSVAAISFDRFLA